MGPKKKYFLSFSLLLLIVIGSSLWINHNNSNNPDKILSKYLSIIQEQTYDYNDSFKYVYTEPLSEKYLQAVKDRSVEPDRPTFEHFQIGQTDECTDNDKCELKVTYTWFDDVKTDVYFQLIKINGEWKIDLTEFEKEYLLALDEETE